MPFSWILNCNSFIHPNLDSSGWLNDDENTNGVDRTTRVMDPATEPPRVEECNGRMVKKVFTALKAHGFRKEEEIILSGIGILSVTLKRGDVKLLFFFFLGGGG